MKTLQRQSLQAPTFITFIIERAPSDRGDENVTALLGHYDATDQTSQPTNRPTSQPNDQKTDMRVHSGRITFSTNNRYSKVFSKVREAL